MKKIIQKIHHELEASDIQINGDRPWDIQVHDDRLYDRMMRQGSLGLGEAYMDGWWEAEALDQFFTRILQAKLDKKFVRNPTVIFEYLKSLLTNRQNKVKAREIGKHHYDIGNDLYRAMLDRRMVYTCGY
jgi:cyclopropane-fatty-acyl-phospholipid synthase